MTSTMYEDDNDEDDAPDSTKKKSSSTSRRGGEQQRTEACATQLVDLHEEEEEEEKAKCSFRRCDHDEEEEEEDDEDDLIMFSATSGGKKKKLDSIKSFLSSHQQAPRCSFSSANHILHESQVEYKLFILIDNLNNNSSSSTSHDSSTPSSSSSSSSTTLSSSADTNANTNATTTTLLDEHKKQADEIYEKMIDYCNVLANDYIWNNEKFYLSKPSLVEFYKDKLSSYYACNGVFDIGDNLDDEWFTVYILLKLTSKFSKVLAAQVQDSDGEFLLIHSANYLPAWASSAADNFMQNRVFLYDGKLHMIPPASTPAEVTYLPAGGPIANPLDAVKIVHDFPKLTCALDTIQKSIQKRLGIFDSIACTTSSAYSGKYSLFHKATCTIPAKLAWVLNNNPSLISSAVNRFCDKDPSDLKLCRLFDCFKPMDFVNYRVKFTKHLYGKLKYCDYKPDKRHEWPSLSKLMTELNAASSSSSSAGVSGVNAASLPSNATASIIQERSMMGFKLTCAFEIMSKYAMKDVSVVNNRSSPAALPLSTLTSFEEYVQRLKSFGYFGNNIEDSKKYNELLDQARKAFELEQNQQQATQVKSQPTRTLDNPKQAKAASVEPLSSSSLESSTSSVSAKTSTKGATSEKYSQLMESLYAVDLKNYDYVNKVKEVINTDQIKEEDDSDDWLCVDAPQLDDYLEMYSRGESTSAYDFRMITNAFKRFLQSPSKANKDLLEGAEFKPIEKELDADGQLIDFNIEKIESNLNDILVSSTTASATAGAKSKPAKADQLEGHEGDDENDSFYEVGGDELLDENLTKEEIEASTNSLKNYMNLMDAELSDQRNLSRLNQASTAARPTTTTATATEAAGNDLDININLVSNALESYSSQCGLTGPVSNIFKSLGL